MQRVQRLFKGLGVMGIAKAWQRVLQLNLITFLVITISEYIQHCSDYGEAHLSTLLDTHSDCSSRTSWLQGKYTQFNISISFVPYKMQTTFLDKDFHHWGNTCKYMIFVTKVQPPLATGNYTLIQTTVIWVNCDKLYFWDLSGKGKQVCFKKNIVHVL